ncbi:MAG TPA: hypothetical protein PLJ08_15860 [Cyclobacteriaceae bacterium]|nr:hypothetical protein [Cyclobacteriaceae bacterium]
MKMDKTLLRKSGSRVTTKMSEQDYEKLSVFIISTLEQASDEGVTLHDLVQEAQEKFNTDFRGNVSWYLLEVKYDLELRKIITKTLSAEREQIIKLNPDGDKKWWFN